MELAKKPSKWSEEEKLKVVDYMSKWDLKKLRRHQSIIRKQLEMLYPKIDPKNPRLTPDLDKAHQDLDVMDNLVIKAIDKKSFKEGILSKILNPIDTVASAVKTGMNYITTPEEPEEDNEDETNLEENIKMDKNTAKNIRAELLKLKEDLNNEGNAEEEFVIYDNDGKTADRYTAFKPGHPEDMLSFCDEPEDPQGFSQFGEGEEGEHLGKKINFKELPEKLQAHVRKRFAGDNEETQLEESEELKTGTIGKATPPVMKKPQKPESPTGKTAEEQGKAEELIKKDKDTEPDRVEGKTSIKEEKEDLGKTGEQVLLSSPESLQKAAENNLRATIKSFEHFSKWLDYRSLFNEAHVVNGLIHILSGLIYKINSINIKSDFDLKHTLSHKSFKNPEETELEEQLIYNATKLAKTLKEAKDKKNDSMKVQSVVVSKDKAGSKEAAKSKVKSMGFKTGDVDTKEKSYRFRQKEPGQFNTFRTSEEKDGGIKFVYGKK